METNRSGKELKTPKTRVALFTPRFVPGYLNAAWALTGAFAAGTLLLFWLARVAPERRLRALSLAALAFEDHAIGEEAVADGVLGGAAFTGRSLWSPGKGTVASGCFFSSA